MTFVNSQYAQTKLKIFVFGQQPVLNADSKDFLYNNTNQTQNWFVTFN